MRRRGWVLLSAALFVAFLAVLGCWAVLGLTAEPEPLPRLLRGVDTRGGWWGACPPLKPDTELALSPQLNLRLLHEFPPGSAESRLAAELAKIGFHKLAPCKEDPTVQVTSFTQRGGSIYHPPMFVTVFWKLDASGALVWTKGFVDFNGL